MNQGEFEFMKRDENCCMIDDINEKREKNQCFSSDTLRIVDNSTVASLSAQNIFSQSEMKEEQTTLLNQKRRNYNCYVNNCKMGYKYLYMFKYHLAGHDIFHFDCNLCNKRFQKYLVFKKHFKVNHQMHINDYNVVKAESTPQTKRRGYIKANCFVNPASVSRQEAKVKSLDDMLIDFFVTLDSQIKKQNEDFISFDPKILDIKSEEYPSFSRCIEKL